MDFLRSKGLYVAITLAVMSCLIAFGVVTRQRDAARGEVKTMTVKLENATRALEQEKLATADALHAAQAQATENADLSQRTRAAIDGLNFQLQNYREQLTKCTTAPAVAKRLGAFFPVTP